MKTWIENTFNCHFLSFAEWDGEGEAFTVAVEGRILRADSLPLLIAALLEASGAQPLLRLAA